MLGEYPELSALQAKSSYPTRIAVRAFLTSHNVQQQLARSEAFLIRLESDAPIAVFPPPVFTFIIKLLAAWRLSVAAVSKSPLYPAAALAPLVQMFEVSSDYTWHTIRRTHPSTALLIIALRGEE